MNCSPGGALDRARRAWEREDLEAAAAELERCGDEGAVLAAAIERTCGVVRELLGDVALGTDAASLARVNALRSRVWSLMDPEVKAPTLSPVAGDLSRSRVISHDMLCARLPANREETARLHGRGLRAVLLERDAATGDLWWLFGPLRKKRGALLPAGLPRAARRAAWLGLRALVPLALRTWVRARPWAGRRTCAPGEPPIQFTAGTLRGGK